MNSGFEIDEIEKITETRKKIINYVENKFSKRINIPYKTYRDNFSIEFNFCYKNRPFRLNYTPINGKIMELELFDHNQDLVFRRDRIRYDKINLAFSKIFSTVDSISRRLNKVKGEKISENMLNNGFLLIEEYLEYCQDKKIPFPKYLTQEEINKGLKKKGKKFRKENKELLEDKLIA